MRNASSQLPVSTDSLLAPLSDINHVRPGQLSVTVTQSDDAAIVAMTTIDTASGRANPQHATSSAAAENDLKPQDFSHRTPIDADTAAFIKWKVSRLCRIPPFTAADTDDLKQELSLAWALDRHRHDATRGALSTFRKTVIDRTAANLLEKARAGKRYCPTTASLGHLATRDGSAGCFELHRDCRRATSRGSSLTAEQFGGLHPELSEVIQTLPAPMIEICEMLMYQSITEISHELGIPPTTAYSRLAAIRLRLQDYRLSDFL